MNIITKTVLKEHVGPFFLGIATIVFLFLMNVIFRDLGRLLGKGLPVIVIVKFFYLNLAWILALAVPMSVLLASLMAFGRMSADNEITALKSSGVHFFRLLSPVLIAALIITILMVPFNNKVLPEFNHQWRILFSDISRTRPMLALEPDVFYNLPDRPGYTILVHRVEEKKNLLEGIVINDTQDPRFNKTIVAEKGQLILVKNEERMVLTLYNGEVHQVEKDKLENYQRVKFVKQSFSINISDAVYKQSTVERRGDREKSASMMMGDIRKNSGFINESQDNIRRAVKNNLSGIFPFDQKDPVQTVSAAVPGLVVDNRNRMEQLIQIIQGERSTLRGIHKSIASLRVEIHKKFSIPIASLVFILVGAPLGVMVRQGSIATAGWLSIVFYLIYWSFLIGGEQLADRMLIHPIAAMWAPNILVGAAGVWLVIQTTKEAPLFPGFRRMGFRGKGKKT